MEGEKLNAAGFNTSVYFSFNVLALKDQDGRGEMVVVGVFLSDCNQKMLPRWFAGDLFLSN